MKPNKTKLGDALCRYCGKKDHMSGRLSCTDCFNLGLRYVYWERAVRAKKPLMLDTSKFERIESPFAWWTHETS